MQSLKDCREHGLLSYALCCYSVQANAALNPQQEKRLKQMGATVRNASFYLEKMKMNEARKTAARITMEKMSIEQLSELHSFYHMMGKICSEVFDKKLEAT